MPMSFQPYRPLDPWQMTSQGIRPTTSNWGPADVSQSLQQGIGGLYNTYKNSFNEAKQSGIADAALKAQLTPGEKAVGLAGPGGPYADPGATGSVNVGGSQASTGAKLPTFAGGGGGAKEMPAGTNFGPVGSRLMADLQKDFGLTPNQAAGVTGPLAMESGGFGTLQELKPTVPGSRGGFGYAQWTGPRRVAFENFAKQNGLDPNSYEANYGYLKHELQNTPEGAILDKVRSTDDPRQAAALFTGSAASKSGFLRPGAVNMDARFRWTDRALGLSGGAGPQAAPAAGGGGGGEVFDAQTIQNANAILQQPDSTPPMKQWAQHVIQASSQPQAAPQAVPQAAPPGPAIPPPQAGGPAMQMPGQPQPQPGPQAAPQPEPPHPTGPGPSPIELDQQRRQQQAQQAPNPTPTTNASQPLFPPPGGAPAVGNAPPPQDPKAPGQPAMAGTGTVATNPNVQPQPQPPPQPGPPPGPLPLMAQNPQIGGAPVQSPAMQMPPGTEGPPPPAPPPPPAAVPVAPPPPPPPVAAAGVGGGGGQDTLAGGAGRGGTSPGFAAAAPAQLTDRHRRMLALAAASGNPHLLDSAKAIVGAEMGTAGSKEPWKVIADGRGGFLRYNESTGAFDRIGGMAQTPEGDEIVAPPNPKGTPEEQAAVRQERLKRGIPQNDNRTWRIKTNERGAKSLEPLDDRESKDFEHIQSLSGKLESNETVKTYRKAVDAVASMEQAFGQQNAAGDVNGLVQVFKTIDPGSTVTQNEAGQITASGGADAWLQSWANKINQKGMMTPQMRADFMNAARDQLKARNSQASAIVEGTRRQAKLAGLDEEAATGYFQDSKIFARPRYTADDFGARPVDPRGGVRIGDVVEGHSYIGGPVNDPKSWRAVQ